MAPIFVIACGNDLGLVYSAAMAVLPGTTAAVTYVDPYGLHQRALVTVCREGELLLQGQTDSGITGNCIAHRYNEKHSGGSIGFFYQLGRAVQSALDAEAAYAASHPAGD